ncbi:MAG TPA: hypothetical protein VMB85_20655 [Bryobacteraceae bacterium]|nr:hypothetical protein [Bryobacteraceae bacterium]
MTGRRKILIVAAGAVTAGLVAALAIHARSAGQIKTLTGVVLRADEQVRNQVPIADAEIHAAGLPARMGSPAKTAGSGLFRLNLPPNFRRGEPLSVAIAHPGYQTLETTVAATNESYVFFLRPAPAKIPEIPNQVTVTSPRVRYAVRETSTINVGSAAQTFEVINQANVPCNGAKPCSPDGRWKASLAGKALDAGDGNSFEDARVTCIAGPCPFTRIEKDDFSAGGRHVDVLVRNWSDTATFLFEAEVTHTMVSDAIRESYPAIFDGSMDFTLPPTGEGPSIQATVGGQDIVFPLTPEWGLTWASCNVTKSKDGTKLFHCDMKSGYRLQ